jgi:hypothetical protein
MVYIFVNIKQALNDLSDAERQNDTIRAEEIKNAIDNAWSNYPSRGGKRKSRRSQKGNRKNKRKTIRRRS